MHFVSSPMQSPLHWVAPQTKFPQLNVWIGGHAPAPLHPAMTVAVLLAALQLSARHCLALPGYGAAGVVDAVARCLRSPFRRWRTGLGQLRVAYPRSARRCPRLPPRRTLRTAPSKRRCSKRRRRNGCSSTGCRRRRFDRWASCSRTLRHCRTRRPHSWRRPVNPLVHAPATQGLGKQLVDT